MRSKGNWTGDRKQTTLWAIPSGGQDTETAHGTQKPVECMRRPMLNNSSPGDAVYDPFLGSGTTLIAAQTHRPCLSADSSSIQLMSMSALRRWQAFTGQCQHVPPDGRPFDECAAEPARQQEAEHARPPAKTHTHQGADRQPRQTSAQRAMSRGPSPSVPECPAALGPVAQAGMGSAGRRTRQA